MQPLFSVSIHDIDTGGLARSFELPLSWLERVMGDTDITASEPGHADVRLSRTGHDVIVRGKVKAILSQPCARCLAPTTVDVEGEISLLLRPQKAAPARPEQAAGKHGPAGGAAGKEGGKRSAGAGKDAPRDARQSRANGKDAPRGNGASRRPRDDEDEYEFSSEEADADVYDGETVVLDDFLREALLLEVPSFPLCSEDCPGIRPSARATPQRDEPMDPRLSPLRALKTKLMLASGPDTAQASPPPEGEKAAPGPRAPERGAERPARTGMPPRPKIQSHRTAGSSAKVASRKSKSKARQSPKKTAK